MEHWSPVNILLLWYRITRATWHANDSHVFAGRLESLENVQISTMSMCWMVVVITGKSLVLCNWCTGWCLCHEKNYENNGNIEMDLFESRLHQTLILTNDGLSSFHDISPSNVLLIWRVTSPCYHIQIPCCITISYPIISHYIPWI